MFCHAIESWRFWTSFASRRTGLIDRRAWMHFTSLFRGRSVDSQIHRDKATLSSLRLNETVQSNHIEQNNSLLEVMQRKLFVWSASFLIIESTLRSSWPDLNIPVFWRHWRNAIINLLNKSYHFKKGQVSSIGFAVFQFSIVFDIQFIGTSHSACCRLAVSFT